MTTDSRPKQKRMLGWFLATPGLIWLAIFFFAPVLIILVFSFGHRPESGGVELGFSFANYANLVEPIYWRILSRTIRLALLNTAICLILSLPLAWYLAFDAHGVKKQVLLLAIIVPFWLTLLVRVYAYYALLRPGGLLASALFSAGILASPFQLLFTEFSTLLGLVTGYIPLMALPIYASLERLAKSNYLQASADLGASPLRTFIFVALPLAAPGIWAGTILVFVPSLGAYIVPTLLGGGKIRLLGNLIADNFLLFRDYSRASAFAVVLLVFVGIALFRLIRVIDRDFHF